MPRVNVPITQFTRDGATLPTPTAGDATNGHSVTNDGRVGLIVKNTGSTVSRNITFLLTKKVDGLSVTSRVETLVVGEEQGFGPFDPNDYGTTLNFDVTHAELTIRAIRI